MLLIIEYLLPIIILADSNLMKYLSSQSLDSQNTDFSFRHYLRYYKVDVDANLYSRRRDWVPHENAWCGVFHTISTQYFESARQTAKLFGTIWIFPLFR